LREQMVSNDSATWSVHLAVAGIHMTLCVLHDAVIGSSLTSIELVDTAVSEPYTGMVVQHGRFDIRELIAFVMCKQDFIVIRVHSIAS
jgi:hypothetical protein